VTGTGAHYLALDQGSHASKAVIFDAEGTALSAAETAIATHEPHPGWVEHDAEEIVASLQDAIVRAHALGGQDPRGVAVAGLATQRSSIVCWDRRTGAALSPVLSWRDRRNAAWLSALELDAAQVREISGLVVSPHYGASKLRWCLDHLPDVRRARSEGRLCCGPLATFLLHRLLAERPCLVDPANASRTLLWDVRSRNWSPRMLDAFGVPEDCLPACVPSRHPFGTLRVGNDAVPLTVMTGDQPAALFAWGDPAPGSLFVNIGTGAFIQRVGSLPSLAATGLLQGVAWQDDAGAIEVVEGTVNGAGAALEWLADRHRVPVESLLGAANGWLDECPDPPWFINGIGGLGSPFWVSDCPVRFSRPAELPEETVAVLESIVFLLVVNIERMRRAAGPSAPDSGPIIASGGLASVDGVCQRLADLADRAVERPGDIQATARGVAWLLGSAVPPDKHRSRYLPQRNTPLKARFEGWLSALERSLAVR
jgi:glycerol kinase